MNVIPGQFVANGHDYRASLARFTSLAYDLPADDDTIATLNRVLAERELQWAERRVIDQQYADAQAQVTEQLAKWDVHGESVATVVAPGPQTGQ